MNEPSKFVAFAAAAAFATEAVSGGEEKIKHIENGWPETPIQLWQMPTLSTSASAVSTSPIYRL